MSCGSWRAARRDRKSTRLNSSHRCISYAVFCLKKKILLLELGLGEGLPEDCVVVLAHLLHDSVRSLAGLLSHLWKLPLNDVYLYGRRPPTESTLFPYTTLFRSGRSWHSVMMKSSNARRI